MDIQWYPGHMVKAKREIIQYLQQVDMVVELADARAPASTRNPDLQEINRKPVLIALTKDDLADPDVTQQWLAFWRSRDISAVVLDLQHNRGVSTLLQAIQTLAPPKRRLPRALVVGIPNVGKSTLINRFAGRSSAKTGAKPGVTRGRQWIKAKTVQLLDTPGVLWPKFANQDAAQRLALLAAIRDDIFDWEETALWLLNHLEECYPDVLSQRYQATSHGVDWLDEIGRRRGCLRSGGIVDTELAAKALLQDFRTGKLGRISLESPSS